jgi:hypothetical protein
LRQETNEDILAFERNYDILSLTAVLHSLNPAEIQRRRILGINFSAAEAATSAANLSFHTMSLDRLGLHPRSPAKVMAVAEPFLREFCLDNPCDVDSLWYDGRRDAAPPVSGPCRSCSAIVLKPSRTIPHRCGAGYRERQKYPHDLISFFSFPLARTG